MPAAGLESRSLLLALACATNVGSAATLIGNPQNMLIGATLQLDFGDYFGQVMPVVLPSLMVTWAIIVWCSKSRWTLQISPGGRAAEESDVTGEEFDRWQTVKGLGVAAALIVLFLATEIPREIAALGGAGVLLLSRKLHSSKTLALVDWELLVLFIGLFIVNRALEDTGFVQAWIAEAADHGIALDHPAALFVAGSVLSNIVSNVPAVMLLLPLATHEQAGPLLAVVTTLAGNLLIVGSIANIIVVDAAKRCGIDIDWRAHARIGVPVTLSTLVIAGLWFAMGPTPIE